MYRPINGWTKAKMIKQIKKYVPKTKPCMDDVGACAYRSGRYRCAVGAFIPTGKENYDAFNFIGSARDLVKIYGHLKSEMPLSINALTSMQKLHDSFDKDSGLYVSTRWRDQYGSGPQEALINWIKKNVED